MSESTINLSPHPSSPHSPSRRTWLFRLGVLALLCIAGYWLGSNTSGFFTPAKPPPNGGLVIDPKHLDFGTVWEQKDFKWVLPIENPTDKDIEVLGFAASCGCAVVEPTSLIVAPRETVPVHVRLDLTERILQDAGISFGDCSISIVPNISIDVGSGCPIAAQGCSARQQGWVLKGQVRRVLRFSPAFADFEDSLIRGYPFPSKEVAVAGTIPIRSLTAHCDTASATVLVSRPAANEFKLQIMPKSSLPRGRFEFPITVRATSADDQELPQTELIVRGRVLDDIQAIPDYLAFGSKPLGGKGRETIRIHSAHGNEFDIECIESLDPSVSISQCTLSAGREYLLDITQMFCKSGDQASIVHVHLRERKPSAELFQIDLRTTYHGLENE